MSKENSAALHNDALRCLLGLPTALSQKEIRQRLLEKLKQQHPSIKIDLVTVPRPDGHYADFSLLLRYPDGVVAKLAAVRDEGDPWQVSTAEPWASDTILSVDGQHLSIHSCILYIDNCLKGGESSLALEIENRLLMQNEMKQILPSVEQSKIDHLERIFRRQNGLLAREKMMSWLEEKGLSYRDFQDLMALNLRLEQFREVICAERREQWQFENTQLLSVTMLRCKMSPISEAEAREWLAEILLETHVREDQAVSENDFSLKFTSRWLKNPNNILEIRTDWGHRLGANFEQAVSSPGDWIRLEDSNNGGLNWCKIVHQKVIKTSDPAFIDQVDELIFKEWISSKRADAKVFWHWR